MYKNEVGYLKLLKDIMEKGVDVPSRAGLCRALLGVNIEFDDYCLSTVRSAPLRLAFHEQWFFLRGHTQTKMLEAEGCNFWKPQTSKEFQKLRGVDYLDEGELGSCYSLQWRSAGGYDVSQSRFTGKSTSEYGVDQLKELIESLGKDRYSRRNLVNLWGSENEHAVITPCWFASQWIVLPNSEGRDELHCQLFNRSNDALFGATFSFQGYRLLQIALCKMFGFELGKLRATISHAHIYAEQFEYVEETLQRELGVQGEISLNKDIKTLDDLLSLEWEDWSVDGLVVNKTPYKTPKPKMAV